MECDRIRIEFAKTIKDRGVLVKYVCYVCGDSFLQGSECSILCREGMNAALWAVKGDDS